MMRTDSFVVSFIAMLLVMIRCSNDVFKPQSTTEGTYSKALVVGTHRDLESSCSESQVQKNKKTG